MTSSLPEEMTTRGVRIDLSFPWDPELLSLARLTASTVASRLEFDIDDIEDVRLAIDELCMACAEGAGPDSLLHLSFEREGDELRVRCTVDHVVELPRENDDLLAGMTAGELSRRILAELVDAYEIGPVTADGREGYLQKRRAATSR